MKDLIRDLIKEIIPILNIYDKMYDCDDKPLNWPRPDGLGIALIKVEEELKKSRLGMYGENPTIEVGEIKISDFQIPPDNTVWLEHKDGDGMQADKEELSKVLVTFYNRNF
jgi:hypothetical protein